MTLFSRLTAIAKSEGFHNPKLHQIADLCGLSRSRLSQIKGEGEAAELGAEALLRLKDRGYSPDWVQHGKGDMRNTAGPASTDLPRAQSGAEEHASAWPPQPSHRIAVAPTAVTIDLPAECLMVWEQLQQLSKDDREEWLARLDIAAGQARLQKLGRTGARDDTETHEAPEKPRRSGSR
jgi:hypothetical protein